MHPTGYSFGFFSDFFATFILLATNNNKCIYAVYRDLLVGAGGGEGLGGGDGSWSILPIEVKIRNL